jgi:hypothetical protein
LDFALLCVGPLYLIYCVIGFKYRFLEEQLKEAVARAESAERDVVRNENIVTGVKLDLQAWVDKRAKIDKEIDKIDELVGGLSSFNALDEPEPEPEVEPEPEPEPEEEPEED